MRSSATAKPRASLDLVITARTGRAYAAYLRRYLPGAHAILSPHLCELSVAIVGDSEMADLHERFLEIASPTDVLTFELQHDRTNRVIAGEVVICLGEARRQAKIRGGKIERELLLYAIHGMMHLSGFDDRTPSRYRAMHAMEDRILIELGIGAVFDGATRPAKRAGVA